MKTMAFELSSRQGSIALIEDDVVLFDQTFASDRKHSGLFFENLSRCRQQFGAPDALVVGLGPGSYAGVRIAIATAVGLRTATRGTLCGLPSICALEVEAREYCVIGDARRQSFFLARVRDGRMIEGPDLHSASELETMIRDASVPIYSSEPLPQFPGAFSLFRLRENWRNSRAIGPAKSLIPGRWNRFIFMRRTSQFRNRLGCRSSINERGKHLSLLG